MGLRENINWFKRWEIDRVEKGDDGRPPPDDAQPGHRFMFGRKGESKNEIEATVSHGPRQRPDWSRARLTYSPPPDEKISGMLPIGRTQYKVELKWVEAGPDRGLRCDYHEENKRDKEGKLDHAGAWHAPD